MVAIKLEENPSPPASPVPRPDRVSSGGTAFNKKKTTSSPPCLPCLLDGPAANTRSKTRAKAWAKRVQALKMRRWYSQYSLSVNTRSMKRLRLVLSQHMRRRLPQVQVKRPIL